MEESKNNDTEADDRKITQTIYSRSLEPLVMGRPELPGSGLGLGLDLVNILKEF